MMRNPSTRLAGWKLWDLHLLPTLVTHSTTARRHLDGQALELLENCEILVFMKTQLTTSSPQHIPGQSTFASNGSDWKRMFRQNVLDLNPRMSSRSDDQLSHWALQEKGLMQLVETIQSELSKINALLQKRGEQMIDCDHASVLTLLGVHGDPKPAGFFETCALSVRVLFQFSRLMWSIRSDESDLLHCSPSLGDAQTASD
jgi:hypothetical protein